MLTARAHEHVSKSNETGGNVYTESMYYLSHWAAYSLCKNSSGLQLYADFISVGLVQVLKVDDRWIYAAWITLRSSQN